jgi:dipeptidyl aminopeptidase/acylaminoacyl peptidase
MPRIMAALIATLLFTAQPPFELKRRTYQSDGLEVVAFVYQPVTSAGKLPVIIYNRGSYIRNNTTADLMPMYERLGTAGFVVVAPMYRGSEGAPGRDEMGGADVDDLMNVQAVIRGLPSADTANLFMYGESRGGMMTLQALRDQFPVRAAAVFGAFTDLDALFSADPRSAAAASQIWPDYAANHQAIAERRSAQRWADRITTPLLILHGADDRDVSPEHSVKLAALLKQHGTPHELVIVPGANHVMRPFEADRDRRAVEWFRRHLKK